MRALDLPESILLGTVPSDKDALLTLLRDPQHPLSQPITHAGVVYKQTGTRLFIYGVYGDAAALVNPICTVEGLADELLRLARTLSLAQPPLWSEAFRKGWELKYVKIPRQPGIIASLVWISPQ